MTVSHSVYVFSLMTCFTPKVLNVLFLFLQLQVVANVEVNDKILQLFEYENSEKPERPAHLAYLGNARVILPDENIYRLEYASPMRLMFCLYNH